MEKPFGERNLKDIRRDGCCGCDGISEKTAGVGIAVKRRCKNTWNSSAAYFKMAPNPTEKGGTNPRGGKSNTPREVSPCHQCQLLQRLLGVRVSTTSGGSKVIIMTTKASSWNRFDGDDHQLKSACSTAKSKHLFELWDRSPEVSYEETVLQHLSEKEKTSEKKKRRPAKHLSEKKKTTEKKRRAAKHLLEKINHQRRRREQQRNLE
ncbi:hypothetical protein WISP_51978 [Willisornis vidua]|uniref:Uncharacterized protein n=1 Tax=Willisornis vidua TaxID=1566151 RepID=A0ABQ9DII3_9PASS|nr:hypothetical protein WISP_51978 [Willisornis vidua]